MRKFNFTMLLGIFTFSLIVLAFTPAHADRKALLIGVARYQNLPADVQINGQRRTLNNLMGPANDVEAMKNSLISSYGFRAEDIKTLVNIQATKQNIQNAFYEWLVNQTKEGDIAFFYFSGHGARVPDQNGDEEDGYDEALLPYDMSPKDGNNIIIDDELGSWLRRLNGRKTVVVLDSCFSGGGTRGLEKTVWNEKFIIIPNYQPTTQTTAIPKGSSDAPKGIIFMAASQKNQMALEISGADGRFYGGFTTGLSQAIKSLKNPTYKVLFDHAKHVVIDDLHLPQVPKLEGQATLVKQYAFRDIIPTPLPPQKIDNRPTPPPEIVGNRILLAVENIRGASRMDMERIRRVLSRLDTVTLVTNQGFFDRIIRGEKSQSEYHVKLLNRIGDAELIAPVRSITELTRKVAQKIDSAFMVKQLLSINNPSPAFGVTLAVSDEDKRDFRLSDEIVFKFSATKDCYILLINMDSQGNFDIIFPNPFYLDNFVRANTMIKIPDENMIRNNFLFRFHPPAGEETVKLIATTKPLTLENLNLSNFLDPSPTMKGGTRRILYESVVNQINSHVSTDEASPSQQKFEWATTTVVVRSHPVP